MTETAAHLVDQVITRVSVRQWVLSGQSVSSFAAQYPKCCANKQEFGSHTGDSPELHTHLIRFYGLPSASLLNSSKALEQTFAP